MTNGAPARGAATRHRALLLFAAWVALLLVAWGVGPPTGHREGTPRAVGHLPVDACAPPHATSPAGVAASVDPALVDVTVTLGGTAGYAAGTGMVLTHTGEVLTNNHLVQGATAVSVVDVGDGRRYSATVVGYDIDADVAVLRLHAARGLRVVPFDDSRRAAVGTPVAVIGNAGGVGGVPSCARGNITGLHRAITATEDTTHGTEQLSGLIATSARVRFGESGGAMVDSRSRVIGMVTATASGRVDRGYAIPADRARAIAARVVAGRSSGGVHVGPTASLGVRVAALPPSVAPLRRYLVVVAAVVPRSPAGAIGVAPGDEVVSVGGRAVTGPVQLTRLLQHDRPGAHVRLAWRDSTGRLRGATIALVAGPPA